MENNPEHSKEIFFKNLSHYLGIAYRDAIWRINHVAKIRAGQSPLSFIWGGLTKLQPDETLEKIVYSPRTTVSIGIIGLYECTKYITGESQFEKNGNKFAHEFFDYINEKNDEMTKQFGTYFGLYGTPAETKVDTFARACLRDFGQVGDGTQRVFLTNSYHHLVSDKVDAFTKITDETQFSDKTTSGAIMYVEVPNLSNNIETMLALIEHIGNTCLYAEVNSEVSNCSGCGFSGYDFKKITAEDGTVRWQCPCCGETDPSIVKTSYRICGYISNYTPNEGRSQDILMRVKHLNLEE